jgi:hypothetical protein
MPLPAPATTLKDIDWTIRLIAEGMGMPKLWERGMARRRMKGWAEWWIPPVESNIIIFF